MNTNAQTFDLVVVGGGSAGTSGAFAAGSFGKKVALVERCERLGGAGVNTGTLPSKTLRESALLLNGWRARKVLGVDVQVRQEAKLAEFMYHASHVCAAERERLEFRAKETGVERLVGSGCFIDPHTIVVTDAGVKRTAHGDFVLIATGSSPVRPSAFPFEHPRVYDSDELLKMEALPRVLAVIGAGVIGSEYACTFAALGVQVHLVDGRDTLLPFLDQDISAALVEGMTRTGVRFHWKERVQKCEVAGPDCIRLALTSGTILTVTDVLVAAGRTSNTGELNLEAAGLKPKEHGLITVDEHFRTAVPHIYATGDVIGAPALAATAMEQARAAVCHAFQLANKDISPSLPTGIFTIPEAGMVGETEQALKDKGIAYIVGRANYRQNPRGKIIGDEAGFLKLLFRAGDLHLVGVHAVGEQAVELVHIGLVAMSCGADANFFSTTCFNYPTLDDLYKYASYDALLKHMSRETRQSQ
jgi:NAD(P) transhydrogenase